MEDRTVWTIAYINRGFIDIAQKELERYGYNEIEAYIPTVRLLKKKFKGKNVFEFVPLLFNYGFFKMPYNKAINPDYLMELRQRITCIYAWVKDPAKIYPNKTNLRKDNSGFIDALPQAAIATDKEVSRMIKASQSMSIYCSEDLKRINSGDHLILQGYPFDGMPAEIIKINHKKGEVVVKLNIEAIVKEVTVSFENVFYTVYKNFNEATREESSDEMAEKYGENAIDHIVLRKKYLSDLDYEQ